MIPTIILDDSRPIARVYFLQSYEMRKLYLTFASVEP